MIKCSLKAKQYSQRAKEAWENFTCISLLYCYFNVIYARCVPIINIHLSHEEVLAIAKSNMGRMLQYIYIHFLFFFNKTGKYAETNTDLWKSLSWKNMKNMKNIQIDHFSCDVWLFDINIHFLLCFPFYYYMEYCSNLLVTKAIPVMFLVQQPLWDQCYPATARKLLQSLNNWLGNTHFSLVTCGFQG